jgi:hypothetical protein
MPRKQTVKASDDISDSEVGEIFVPRVDVLSTITHRTSCTSHKRPTFNFADEEALRQAAESKDGNEHLGFHIHENNDPPPPKKKHPYHFVSYQASTSKYFARVHLNNRRNNAGSYLLGADAAYAADELNKLIGGPLNKINFHSIDDYCRARELELEASRSVGGLVTVQSVGTAKHAMGVIQQRVREAKAKIDSRKVAYGLSASQFAALSKKGDEHPVEDNTGSDSVKADNSSQQYRNEPQCNRKNNAEINAYQDENKASHHREVVRAKPKKLPSPSDLIPLESDYMHGCIVSTNMKPNHRSGIYNKGNLAIVTGASFDSITREIYYTIKSIGNNINGNNDDTEMKLCSEKEVAFAPECPILYSPTKSFDNENCVKGKILLVQTKPKLKPLYCGLESKPQADETAVFYYTIIVYSDGVRNEDFEVIEDVPSGQLKFQNK